MSDGEPNSRSALVSFSQNSGVGVTALVTVPSSAASASSSSGPRKGCSISTAPSGPSCMTGLGAPFSHDQVLRNQAVGSTCSVSGSSPTLVAVISTSSSCASSLLAYTTSVIQYRS